MYVCCHSNAPYVTIGCPTMNRRCGRRTAYTQSTIANKLYRDETRGEDASIDKSQMESEVYTMGSEEIEAVIRDLPKGKACGSHNISAELQWEREVYR